MIRIDCFVKSECDACKIAVKSITNAVNEASCDITLNISKISEVATSIKKFPTTIIYKERSIIHVNASPDKSRVV